MAIIDAMVDALKGGVSVQKEVRGYINSKDGTDSGLLAASIAEVCAGFKRHSEDSIPFTATEDEKKDYRKRTNNIINDVSRICRDMLGYSIVNTKRAKGVYEYAAVLYTPRIAKAPALPPMPDPIAAAFHCPKEHFDSAKHVLRPNPNNLVDFIPLFGDEGSEARECYLWVNWTPAQFVSKMEASNKDLEEVAKILLDRIKARRAA